VLVRRLTWRDAQGLGEVALDNPALDRGWWDVEWDNRGPTRWTGGDALLPPLGSGALTGELAGTIRYALSVPSGGEVAELARLTE
jgi:hypothetical protein